MVVTMAQEAVATRERKATEIAVQGDVKAMEIFNVAENNTVEDDVLGFLQAMEGLSRDQGNVVVVPIPPQIF